MPVFGALYLCSLYLIQKKKKNAEYKVVDNLTEMFLFKALFHKTYCLRLICNKPKCEYI